MNERNKHNECYKCKYKSKVLGNAHIKCEKPDSKMKGHIHGIKNGWFYYPILFDPTWKLKDCANFAEVKS